MFYRENSSREQLPQKNHKYGSRPKDFNKNTDTSNASPPKATIALHWPKLNSVCFEYPYVHINRMNNTQGDNTLLDTNE